MAKKKLQRGKPWARLANEMIRIGKPESDAEQTAWFIWFECSCPATFEFIGERKDILKELYEKLSGQAVEGDEEEEEEDDKETEGQEQPPN